MGAETKKAEQVVIASKEDLFLRELMDGANTIPEVWNALDIDIDEQYQDMFRLPPELEPGNAKQAPQAKGYAYVWVEIDDQKMTRLYHSLKFIAVNRTNHPFLPNHYFHGGSGAIQREGTSRHILMYQPRAFNQKMKEMISLRYEERKRDVTSKLDKGGEVSLEVATKEGGYGKTPADAPMQTGWQGEDIEKVEDTYDFADEDSKKAEDV